MNCLVPDGGLSFERTGLSSILGILSFRAHSTERYCGIAQPPRAKIVHPSVPTTNLLLTAMRPEDLFLLSPHLEKVTLTRRQSLATAGQPVDHIYFLEDGVASMSRAAPVRW